MVCPKKSVFCSRHVHHQFSQDSQLVNLKDDQQVSEKEKSLVLAPVTHQIF